MASLIIDTNSWIELAKPRWNILLRKLEEQVESHLIEILVNSIIIEEWDKNKERIEKTIISSIKSHAKSALKISSFIPKEESDSLSMLLEKYRDREDIQIQIAQKHIKRVEKLLYSGHVVPVTDETKLNIIERGLIKKAPFHNGKNNIADALIIFSAIDYVHREKELQKNLIFVSANYKEFSNPKDVNSVHPEIKEDSKSVHLHFTNNIARVLDLKEENVHDEVTYAEFQFWNWIETQAEIMHGK